MAGKSFVARLFSALWRTVALIYALLFLIVAVAVPLGIYFSYFYNPAPTIESNTALVWAPQGDLVEQEAGGGLDLLAHSVASQPERQAVVRVLIQSLDRARHDDRIKLAFLRLDKLGRAEPGQIEDLDAAIDRFRQAGKPVIAWSSSYNQAQYEIASHADRVMLDPLGHVLIPGYGAYHRYYKDALDKLGVKVNVFRVGQYKSFVEPFTRNGMSPAARRANKAWLNSLWKTYRHTVATDRGTTPADITRYVDNFADTLVEHNGDAAHMAAQAGLVDDIATLSAVRQTLAKRVGTSGDGRHFNHVDQADYVAATDNGNNGKPAGASRNRIALIVVEGDIIDGQSVPGSAGSETIARLIASARNDKHVKAVLMRVNSPGGSITASEAIRRQVVKTQQAGKPVVVSMSGVAASGGYWISMNANQIWAQSSTITGSIGVFGIIPTFSQPLNKLGIHTDGVGTTPLSGALRLDKPLSDAVKKSIQAGINHAYHLFVSKVAAARNLKLARVKQIAQGRVWSGRKARHMGLVDKIGGLPQAEHAAAKLADLQTDQYIVEPMQRPSGLSAVLMQFITSQVHAVEPAWLSRLTRDGALASLAKYFNDPQGMYARCFCRLGSGAGVGARE